MVERRTHASDVLANGDVVYSDFGVNDCKSRLKDSLEIDLSKED